jgi:hypothetical protein
VVGLGLVYAGVGGGKDGRIVTVNVNGVVDGGVLVVVCDSVTIVVTLETGFVFGFSSTSGKCSSTVV